MLLFLHSYERTAKEYAAWFEKAGSSCLGRADAVAVQHRRGLAGIDESDTSR
jgi:hypothetical protein